MQKLKIVFWQQPVAPAHRSFNNLLESELAAVLNSVLAFPFSKIEGFVFFVFYVLMNHFQNLAQSAHAPRVQSAYGKQNAHQVHSVYNNHENIKSKFDYNSKFKYNNNSSNAAIFRSAQNLWCSLGRVFILVKIKAIY